MGEIEMLTELAAGGPAALVSSAVLVAAVAFLVGQSKAIVRPIFERLTARGRLVDREALGKPDEHPWGLLAVVYGIALAFVAGSSSLAPAFLEEPALRVLYGIGLGISAMRGRDLVRRS